MSYNSESNRARNFKSASRFALVRFSNYSRDYSLNCTPLGPITITNHTRDKLYLLCDYRPNWTPLSPIAITYGRFIACMLFFCIRMAIFNRLLVDLFFQYMLAIGPLQLGSRDQIFTPKILYFRF